MICELGAIAHGKYNSGCTLRARNDSSVRNHHQQSHTRRLSEALNFGRSSDEAALRGRKAVWYPPSAGRQNDERDFNEWGGLMVGVRFQSFRSFEDTAQVEIRPITFLIGENSSGKTSFLSGLRYLYESFSRRYTNPFNRVPYFLGGFQQIANYRGGRGGRAKSFTLSINLDVPANIRRGERAGSLQPIQHSFTFIRGYPQPEIETWSVTAGGYSLSYSFAQERPKVIVARTDDASKSITYQPRRAPPSRLVKTNSGYIADLIDDLRFTVFTTTTHGRVVPGIVQQEIENRAAFESIGLNEGTPDNLWSLLRRSAEALGRDVFASAPVRTEPFRTYTPSELAASAEGSHVPLELARTKLRSPEQWDKMKRGLVEFGRAAGLFTDIDVRQFGKSDIDPFQILVKIGGPAMNLMDVGYGVSQVLPIVYQLQNLDRYRTFLLQQPEVHLHPRAQAELGTLLTNVAKREPNPTFVVETHSDYMIDRVRIEVANGNISPNQVTIVLFDREAHGTNVTNLYLNESGEIVDPPDEYRAFFLKEHGSLLGLD